MTIPTLACPGLAPRLSLRARLLIYAYRRIVKPLLASRDTDLAQARRVSARLDRWLGAGKQNFERIPVNANGVAADWINVGFDASQCVILYLHGGGFMFRTPKVHARLAARLCHELRAQALLPSYRLAPEHALPAAHDDCLAAYRWLLDEGHEPSRIVLIGDSAGGLLVLALLQRIRDARLPAPACGVMFSPGTDFASIRALAPDDAADDPIISIGALALLQRTVIDAIDQNDPDISPCAGNLGNLPPLLFQVGSTEVLLGQSRKACEQARAAGTEAELQIWPQMPHVWQALHWLPESRRALACVGHFVARHLTHF